MSPHATKFGEQVKALRLAGALTQEPSSPRAQASASAPSAISERGLRAAVCPGLLASSPEPCMFRRDDIAYLPGGDSETEVEQGCPRTVSVRLRFSPPWSRPAGSADPAGGP